MSERYVVVSWHLDPKIVYPQLCRSFLLLPFPVLLVAVHDVVDVREVTHHLFSEEEVSHVWSIPKPINAEESKSGNGKTINRSGQIPRTESRYLIHSRS